MKKLKDILGIKNYDTFVKELGTITKDSKILNMIGGGLLDGNKNDEKIKMEVKSISVQKLIPTQNEIDFDKSITHILKNTFPETIDKIYKGDSVEIVSPIVVLNDKYILDGHHRWSKIYTGNSEATIKCLVLYTDIKPLDMLKILQLAIVQELKKIPTSVVKGSNIFKLDLKKMKSDIEKIITEDALKQLVKHKKISKPDKELASVYFLENFSKLIKTSKPIKDAPSRSIMPQTNVGKKTLTDLEKGKVNFKNPLIKESSFKFMKRFDKFILENYNL